MDRYSDLVESHGLVVAANRRDRQRLRRGIERGELVRVLPDVASAAGVTLDTATRIAALALFDQDAVVLGAAAAKVVWWPERLESDVVAARRGDRKAFPGYRWTRGSFPDDLLVRRGGIRLAGPALSTLQLAMVEGSSAIDEALRRKACTLDDLNEACGALAGRRGIRAVVEMLEDSRDEPWSPAERRLHRHYRAVGCLLHHVTNHRVELDRGPVFLDLAIPDLLLSFEVDGYQVHSTKSAFEWDRDRASQLACLGWQEVRWAATFVLYQEAATRRRIRQIIEARAASFGIGVHEVLRPV